MAGGFIASQSLPLKVRNGERKREENPAGNKTEKEEKKRSCWNPGKKIEPEENNKIKPADLPHIQTNAVTLVRSRIISATFWPMRAWLDHGRTT
jgi:hypothetical protein